MLLPNTNIWERLSHPEWSVFYFDNLRLSQQYILLYICTQDIVRSILYHAGIISLFVC